MCADTSFLSQSTLNLHEEVMKSILFLITLTTIGTSLQAQTSSMPPTNPVVSAMKNEWTQVAGYIAKAADQMPEADYAFKPTPTVRTFGELIGHLAGSQNLICSSALGETPKATEDDIEKNVKTKSGLVAALRASTDFCARAYAQSDAAMSGATKLFGSDATRFAALARNTIHDGEHYGNIVTYMRIKGMVPPSSQPRTQ